MKRFGIENPVQKGPEDLWEKEKMLVTSRHLQLISIRTEMKYIFHSYCSLTLSQTSTCFYMSAVQVHFKQ